MWYPISKFKLGGFENKEKLAKLVSTFCLDIFIVEISVKVRRCSKGWKNTN